MEQLLNSEETELCKILSLALHGKKSFDTDRKTDWNALIQMAEKHKVLPFLFDILQNAFSTGYSLICSSIFSSSLLSNSFSFSLISKIRSRFLNKK